jgi:signal transduction histidine kinase
MIDRNLERLAHLVEDVLQGARLQSGHLGVRMAPLDLARTVQHCVDTFQTEAKDKGVHLKASLVPCTIEADGERLTQVLFNFLGNAMKFTPAGGTVSVEMQLQSDHVTVGVRDTGAGVPPEKQAQLFRPFSQLHENAGLRTGTGLGLYISKGIVDGEGQGSLFWFTIPKVSPSPARPPKA